MRRPRNEDQTAAISAVRQQWLKTVGQTGEPPGPGTVVREVGTDGRTFEVDEAAFEGMVQHLAEATELPADQRVLRVRRR